MSKKIYMPSLIVYAISLIVWIVFYSEENFAYLGINALFEWLLYSSFVALPLFIALYFGKDTKIKTRIYLCINIILAIIVISLDIFSACSGMCFKGSLSFLALVYCAITYLLFSAYVNSKND